MLNKRTILVALTIVAVITIAGASFALNSSRQTVTVEPTPTATPGPDGRVFVEGFLALYGNFDGNRQAYVNSITPLLTPEYAKVFFQGPGAVDERIRRTSKVVSIEELSSDNERVVFEARLLTKNQVVGQEAYEDELVMDVYLSLEGDLWKVSDIQFQLN